MSAIDTLVTAMAEYEAAYGEKPHEIKLTRAGYDALCADAAAKGMTPFPASSSAPRFNGAEIVIVETITEEGPHKGVLPA